MIDEGLKIKIRQATKTGYIEMCNGGVCDVSYPESKFRRGRVQGGGADFTNNYYKSGKLSDY